ncbi:MAG: glycosyltransferase family 2 protein [Rikenellaceae bacterium]
MKISILMPVYNVERYIERTLNSLIAQSYKGAMECIMVNDCSTDSSRDVIESVISRYEQSPKSNDITFKIVDHLENMGVASARNTCLRAASGDYLYFLDSDDDIIPECIELLVDLAEKYRGVDIVQGRRFSVVDGVARTDDYSEKNHPEYSCDKEWIYKNYFRPRAVWNRLMRRSFIFDNQLFFKDGIVYEDSYWSLIASAHIKSIAFCSTPTYQYRVNEDSITTTKYRDKDYISRLKMLLETFISPPPAMINREDIIPDLLIEIVNQRRYVTPNQLRDYLGYLRIYQDTMLTLIKSPITSLRYKLGFRYILSSPSLIKIFIVKRLFGF